MDHASAFIELRGVTAAYSEKPSLLSRLSGRAPVTHSILRGVSFDLDMGPHVTLFGAEGAGKSTLLRLLSGVLTPSSGRIFVNNQPPGQLKHAAAGYVSAEESEPLRETVSAILHAFGATHGVPHFPARLAEISEALDLREILYRPAETLSTTERLRVNLARAALSSSALILLDDTADQLGTAFVLRLLKTVFVDRTVIISTRHAATAEALGLSLLILHNGIVSHRGTTEELSRTASVPRTVDIWIEGVRYDVIRALKQHSGVLEVRLLPVSDFAGQRLRLTVRSAHHLPSVYDTISQTPVVRIEESPAGLDDLITRLFS